METNELPEDVKLVLEKLPEKFIWAGEFGYRLGLQCCEEQLKAKDEIMADKTEFEDKQRAQIKSLKEALVELVHLHTCEQEGLSSGKPTPQQWFDAVNKAASVLNEIGPETKPEYLYPPYIEGETDLQNEG